MQMSRNYEKQQIILPEYVFFLHDKMSLIVANSLVQ